MFKLGDISSSSALLGACTGPVSGPKLDEIRLAAALQSHPPAIPNRVDAPASAPDIGVAYVASRSLPLLSSGYTIRTQEVLRALTSNDVSAVCYVRPGFPHDHKTPLDLAGWSGEGQNVDGLEYVYSHVAPIAEDPEGYIERVSRVLEAHFRRRPPVIVQAASNHRNALPALMAARRIGAPFVYEVRGLWELTTATGKEHDWEETERFKLDRELEVLVAREADHVFAITEGVANELVSSGVDASRVTLLPNAVEPDAFGDPGDPEERRRELGIAAGDFTLVYCGSLLRYEGLDDLIKAVAMLKMRGIPSRAIFVGRGSYRGELEKIVADLALDAEVRFVGPLPQDEARRYLALADAVALPRKPFKVCELVSPLKPFESMAMGKPTVVSDLAALREIVRDGETGFLCRPADPGHLAEVLARLALDPGLRSRVGAAGRDWIFRARTWQKNAEHMRDVYARLRSSLAA
jgi:glycosyltransferase involved in cell wall biosynthesis